MWRKGEKLEDFARFAIEFFRIAQRAAGIQRDVRAVVQSDGFPLAMLHRQRYRFPTLRSPWPKRVDFRKEIPNTCYVLSLIEYKS